VCGGMRSRIVVCRFWSEELAVWPEPAAQGRVIPCHLAMARALAAVRYGKSVDSKHEFTPAARGADEHLVPGSRSRTGLVLARTET